MSIYIYMYIYIYVYIYIHLYKCIYTPKPGVLFIYIYMCYEHIYIYMYVCMYVRTYVCMYVCIIYFGSLSNNPMWIIEVYSPFISISLSLFGGFHIWDSYPPLIHYIRWEMMNVVIYDILKQRMWMPLIMVNIVFFSTLMGYRCTSNCMIIHGMLVFPHPR